MPLVELPTVSFSTVAPGPLTAATPHPSPGVPSHYGSRKPRGTNKGAKVKFYKLKMIMKTETALVMGSFFKALTIVNQPKLHQVRLGYFT